MSLDRKYDKKAQRARRNAKACRPHPTQRRFLTRVEATYALGLMDASQRKEPSGVLVACRDSETGKIFEALPGEFLHAQISLRVGRDVPLDDGWTVPA